MIVPVFCYGCASKMDILLPAMRVSRDPCEKCGGYDDHQQRNYSVDAIQVPGSAMDPNRKAEVDSKQ